MEVEDKAGEVQGLIVVGIEFEDCLMASQGFGEFPLGGVFPGFFDKLDAHRSSTTFMVSGE